MAVVPPWIDYQQYEWIHSPFAMETFKLGAFSPLLNPMTANG